MAFQFWEWIRIICYVAGVPMTTYLALRYAHRKDAPIALLLAGLACMFGWYLLDLTLVSVGLSSRNTRNFFTPLLVFVTGSLIMVTMREYRMHKAERSLRDFGIAAADTNNGAGGISHAD